MCHLYELNILWFMRNRLWLGLFIRNYIFWKHWCCIITDLHCIISGWNSAMLSMLHVCYPRVSTSLVRPPFARSVAVIWYATERQNTEQSRIFIMFGKSGVECDFMSTLYDRTGHAALLRGSTVIMRKNKVTLIDTLVIGYCDYLGTRPKNSHKAIVVTRR